MYQFPPKYHIFITKWVDREIIDVFPKCVKIEISTLYYALVRFRKVID